jgi:myo-inositol-1(or 4)-monophosphatase
VGLMADMVHRWEFSGKMTSSAYADILQRIQAGLEAARGVFERFTRGAIATEYKVGHDPVTEADRAVDAVLRQTLLRDGEGWLSEETADNPSRLSKEKVWIVDPLDGTREFVQGLPEFCVSIGYVESGIPVAGGIYNPATQEIFLGAVDAGVLYNGHAAQASQRAGLDGALILASRSEVKRGEWKQFENGTYKIQAMGSVAYRLALVSAGRADITFTLTPKNEWDVVAGTALVQSGGGFVSTLEKTQLKANRQDPLLSGLLASGPFLKDQLLGLVEPYIRQAEKAR